MKNQPIAYINIEERKLEWATPIEWQTPTIARMDKIALYTEEQLEEARKQGMRQERALWNLSESTQELDTKSYLLGRYDSTKTLTDEEIDKLAKKFGVVGLHEDAGLYEFAKAILRKAQDK